MLIAKGWRVEREQRGQDGAQRLPARQVAVLCEATGLRKGRGNSGSGGRVAHTRAVA